MSNSSGGANTEFSSLRAFFWPVHSYEIKKVLPMAGMMFCVLFNYTILRDIKDAFIVTAPASGAEAISFLKVWGTFPFAILYMSIYAKASTALSKQNLFYGAVIFFIVFFALFGYVLFPMHEHLHMDLLTMENLKQEYPRLQWIVPLIGNWTFSLFYVNAELWGTIGLSILFWQFANDITRISEAKRYYSLFGVIGNLGVILSGYLLHWVTSHLSYLPDKERWATCVPWIVLAVLAMCVVMMFIYSWMQKNVLTDTRLYDPQSTASANKKKKTKLAFSESLKIVFSSKYLGCLAVLILAYGICINFGEVTLKSQAKIQFPNPADYTSFMGKFSMLNGVITVLLMFAGTNIVRRFGWRVGAIFTPIMLFVTGIFFYGFIIFGSSLTGVTDSFGEALVTIYSLFGAAVDFTMNPVLFAVVIGTVQNALTKGTKYAFFDPTKEMAYIPLEENLKTQGKAAVDGVGGRLGKSSGGIIQQLLLVSIPGSTQLTIAPYLAGIAIVVLLAWIWAVCSLAKQFNALSADNSRKADKPEEKVA